MPIASNTPKPTRRVLLYSDVDAVRDPVLGVIEAAPDLVLAARAAGRIEAISKARAHKADLVLLDIGTVGALATLKRMREVLPEVPVVLVGLLNFANVKSSMEGLLLGAVDFIPTPTPNAAKTEIPDFEASLERVLSELGAPAQPTAAPPPRSAVKSAEPVHLSKRGTKSPHVLLIGSSTGGPKALTDFLTQFSGRFHLPILVTQHMPAGFTTTFAANIQRRTGLPTSEGYDGDIVEPGRVYIAPGGRHQLVTKSGNAVTIRLDDGPPVNFCKPAVDPMFESCVDVYDGHILAVILTGMGQDGCEGARKVVAAGGTVLAQDKETSVVWGMPGAVAEAGLAAEVLPLNEIAGRVRALC